jgi:hypothetical protein
VARARVNFTPPFLSSLFTTYVASFCLFVMTVYLVWSRDSSVGMVTRLGLGLSGVRVFPSSEDPHRSGAHPASLSLRTAALFPGVKRPERKADHPAQSRLIMIRAIALFPLYSLRRGQGRKYPLTVYFMFVSRFCQFLIPISVGR